MFEAFISSKPWVGQRHPLRSTPHLLSAALRDRSSHYYSLGDNGQSITCRLCAFTSRDPHDVRERYCPRCRIFHDDRLLMLRLDEGLRAAYHPAAVRASIR